MTERLYRIKPLVWGGYDAGLGPGLCSQHTGIGQYFLHGVVTGWRLKTSYASNEWILFDTLDEAKAAAESHYRERLMMCLEPISVTVTNDGVYLSVS